MRARQIDLTKEIYNGWTVGDFVRALMPAADNIMQGNGKRVPFYTKADLRGWIIDNHPLRPLYETSIQKGITDVVAYFAERYNLKK